MITLRKANERGHLNFGWLDTHHTFSFGSYYDPRHMGFRNLRVINDDHVTPGDGFGTHGHQDMEIITFVKEGKIAHKDSMGNQKLVDEGEIQVMSAGSGITHSEFNASSKDELKFYQIWIMPNKEGISPEYGQVSYKDVQKENDLVTLAGPKGSDKGLLNINADAYIYYGSYQHKEKMTSPNFYYDYQWIQVVEGAMTINGIEANKGDGVAIEKERVNIIAQSDVKFLIFDLA